LFSNKGGEGKVVKVWNKIGTGAKKAKVGHRTCFQYTKGIQNFGAKGLKQNKNLPLFYQYGY
jgi:hypothetical protein